MRVSMRPTEWDHLISLISFQFFTGFWWWFGFQIYPVDIIHIQASLIYGTAINLQKSIYHLYSLSKEYIPPLFSIKKSIYTTSILVPLMVLQLFWVLAAGWSGGAWWRAVLTHPNWSASSLDTPTPSHNLHIIVNINDKPCKNIDLQTCDTSQEALRLLIRVINY